LLFYLKICFIGFFFSFIFFWNSFVHFPRQILPSNDFCSTIIIFRLIHCPKIVQTLESLKLPLISLNDGGTSWSWVYNYLCNKVPITTKIVSSNPVQGEVYSIQHCVIKFVSDLRQVGSFLRVFIRFPPPIKLTEILLKVALNTINKANL
jgi:hypothetical protein